MTVGSGGELLVASGGATLDGVAVGNGGNGIDVSGAVLTLDDSTSISGGTLTVESTAGSELQITAGTGADGATAGGATLSSDDGDQCRLDHGRYRRRADPDRERHITGGGTLTNSGTITAAGTVSIGNETVTNSAGGKIMVGDGTKTDTLTLTGDDGERGGHRSRLIRCGDADARPGPTVLPAAG